MACKENEEVDQEWRKEGQRMEWRRQKLVLLTRDEPDNLAVADISSTITTTTNFKQKIEENKQKNKTRKYRKIL